MKRRSIIFSIMSRLILNLAIASILVLCPSMAYCNEIMADEIGLTSGLSIIQDSLVQDTLHYGRISVAIKHPPGYFVGTNHWKDIAGSGTTTAIVDSITLAALMNKSMDKGCDSPSELVESGIFILIFSDRNTEIIFDGVVTDEEIIRGVYIDKRGYKIKDNVKRHYRIIIIPKYSIHLMYQNIRDEELLLFDKILNNIIIFETPG